MERRMAEWQSVRCVYYESKFITCIYNIVNCEMTSVRAHADKQVLSIYRAKRNNKNDENNTWSDVNGNNNKNQQK